MITNQMTHTRLGARSAVEHVEDPPIARALLGNVRWSWIWLIVRLYVGWEWLQAGWEKLNNAAWVWG